MKSITINGQHIEVRVKPNPRAKKTVRIDFESSSQLTVLIPENAEIDIEKLIVQNRGLIERKYNELEKKIQILNDNGVLFQGERYRLEPHQVESFDDEKVMINDDCIKVYHNHERKPGKVLKKWMTEQTKQLVQETQKKNPDLKPPTRITVADTSRWGYTRDNGVIVYNWQLAALPKELGRYVVIHELVHLDYMNHQNGFKAKLANYFPDIKQHEKQLKKYQQVII